MNVLILLVGSILAVQCSDAANLKHDMDDWHSFKMEYGKTYPSREVEALRRSNFMKNKLMVEEFNAKHSERLGFSMGINHLSDLGEMDMPPNAGFVLPEEHEIALKNTPQDQKFLDDILNDNSIEVPDELDYRKTPGRVSKVKNEGECSSCWAFSTTGVLEGQEAVRGTNFSGLIDLSTQNIIDCDLNSTDEGCSRGNMVVALQFIHQQGGIEDEESYPYEARDGNCRFKKEKVIISDTGAAVGPRGDEQKLKELVAKFGPVAMAVEGTYAFNHYKSGVFFDEACSGRLRDLSYVALIVGYGTDPKSGDYWIVKTSKGTGWGEEGYIRMARNKGNNCGIASVPTIPTF